MGTSFKFSMLAMKAVASVTLFFASVSSFVAPEVVSKIKRDSAAKKTAETVES